MSVIPTIAEFEVDEPDEVGSNAGEDEIFIPMLMTDDELAETRAALREDISALRRRDELLKARKADIDSEIERRLRERGTTSTGTSRYTLSLVEDVAYPQVTDRTAFENYVLKKKSLHLLQFRLSQKALQEEMELGNVPGIEMKTRTTIRQIKKPTKVKSVG